MAITVTVVAALLVQACSSLTADDERDDEEAAAALQCLAIFEGAEYQSLVDQFEAQKDDQKDNPPQLFYGEASQSCYLKESDCKVNGNVLCRIVAESRIFGMPVRPENVGQINPATAGAVAVGAAAVAAVGVGVALGLAGGNSSTTSTTNP